jgi:hypothetical protein
MFGAFDLRIAGDMVARRVLRRRRGSAISAHPSDP